MFLILESKNEAIRLQTPMVKNIIGVFFFEIISSINQDKF